MENTLIFKNDTITLVQCKDGFWLYDMTRRMNLAMKAKTEQEAFVNALMYYQKRLKEVEENFESLHSKVSSFVDTISEDIDS